MTIRDFSHVLVTRVNSQIHSLTHSLGRLQPSPSTDHPIASIFHTRPQLLDALKSGILLQGVQQGSSLSPSSSIPMLWLHSITLPAGSSGCWLQCPTRPILLAATLSPTFGRLSYSSEFGTCCHDLMLRAALSMRVWQSFRCYTRMLRYTNNCNM